MLTPSDWQQLILSPGFLKQLERLADKRFVQPTLAQQAINSVLEKLPEDNWQRLSGFAGRSKPATYALSVASRLLEDFSRHRFGRPRPPAWLQAKGQSWIQIWRMLCLERQWPEMIINTLRSIQDTLDIAAVMREIKTRIPRCGEPGFSECSIEECGEESTQSTNMDDDIAEAQRQLAAKLLTQLLHNTEQPFAESVELCDSEPPFCPSDITFESFSQGCNFSESDRLLLSLSYEDGLSSRKIAELTNQSPSSVQRRLTQIRQTLRHQLTEIGVNI